MLSVSDCNVTLAQVGAVTVIISVLVSVMFWWNQLTVHRLYHLTSFTFARNGRYVLIHVQCWFWPLYSTQPAVQ